MAKEQDLFGQEPRSDRIPRLKLSTEGRRIASELADYTQKALSGYYGALTGIRNLHVPKAVTRDTLADLLDFRTQERFDFFFNSLSPFLQDAIRVTTFASIVDVRPLEKKHGVQFLQKKKLYAYTEYYEVHLNRDIGADLFNPTEDGSAVFLVPPLRRVFSAWLTKPEAYYLKPAEQVEGQEWSNVESVRESILLMAEAAQETLKGMNSFDSARKGPSKSAIKRIRSACGQQPFPVADALGLDSVGLFVRVMNCLLGLSLKKTADGDDFIKRMVDRFFVYDPAERVFSYQTRWNFLEYYVLTDHLSRRSGFGSNVGYQFPSSRSTLRRILGEIAPDGRWHSLQTIHQYLAARGEPIGFCDATTEREGLRLKGDRLRIEDRVWEADPYDRGIIIHPLIRERVLELPLLKAYGYLLALLGVLDIRETEPDRPLARNGDRLPISPYEGLRYIRVTEFGAWCLGMTEAKPVRKIASYEAVADKELLLVTFKGHSLERKLYLESIGDTLGSDRFRITEASFIRGCSTKAQIEARIKKFKSLIEPEPSPRWERFFASVVSRASLFSAPEPALLFSLPDDPDVRRFLMENPKLRAMALKAEGGRVVVRTKDHRKFLKLLKENGFLNPES